MNDSDGSRRAYDIFRPPVAVRSLTREEWMSAYRRFMSCHPVRMFAGDGNEIKCTVDLDYDSDEVVTVLTLASIYYDRFMRTVLLLEGESADVTFGPVFGTACITAAKFACEHQWTMSRYARIMGVETSALLEMEDVFVTRLDHRLWVSRDEFLERVGKFKDERPPPPPLVANSPAALAPRDDYTDDFGDENENENVETNVDVNLKENAKTRWVTVDYDAEDTDEETDWKDDVEAMDRDGRECFFSPGPGSRVRYAVFGPELPQFITLTAGSKRGVKRSVDVR